MASTRTTAAIPTQEAAVLGKGIELTEEEATFDDGNTETEVPSRPKSRRINSTKPSRASRSRNWSLGSDEPEEETPDAEGIRKQLRRDRRCGQNRQEPGSDNDGTERAAKVFTDMEGTSYEKLMIGSFEMSIRIMVYRNPVKETEKGFCRPDNIEDFDIRNYV